MNKKYLMPMLAAALFMGACEEDEESTGVGTQANVRFVNAVSGLNTAGFTQNGNFVAGSSTAFGQATSQCMRINAGSGTFGFGTANSGGTGITGTALTSGTQSLAAGGNFTLVAAGTQTSPQLFLLNNQFSGNLGSNQAAVRFVNLAPGTGSTANRFDVFTGTGSTATTTGLSFGNNTATTFSTMNAGSTTFNFRNAGGTSNLDLGGTNTFTLQGGTTNTIAIVPNSTGTGFRAINITGC